MSEALAQVLVQNEAQNIAANDSFEIPTLKKNKKIDAIVTSDKSLTNQYFKMRHDIFCTEWKFLSYNGAESISDKEGKIVVAISDGKVVGGMRLMFSSDSSLLSNEMLGTKCLYKNCYNKISRQKKNLSFCEISNVVVVPEMRNSDALQNMFQAAIAESKKSKNNYLCGVTTLEIAKEYEIVFRKINHELIVLDNFIWKARKNYNFLKTFPVFVKI